MRRLNLFEFHDFSWCPRVLRDGLTDFLEISIEVLDTYGPVRTRIANLLATASPRAVVDLCSGAGGPWVHWLRKGLVDLPVTLTDKYPNAELRARLGAANGLSYRAEPVDALAVPPDLKGVRTMFTAFHHFRPEQAQAIIEDAVQNRQPIGIFEFTSRSPKAVLFMLSSAIGVWLFTPRMKNVSWKKWILTYAIPCIPLLVTVDGILSCFRSYSERELSAMATGEGYTWSIGVERGKNGLPVTYLIGYPSEHASAIDNHQNSCDVMG
jgi:hypothetical protein